MNAVLNLFSINRNLAIDPSKVSLVEWYPCISGNPQTAREHTSSLASYLYGMKSTVKRGAKPIVINSVVYNEITVHSLTITINIVAKGKELLKKYNVLCAKKKKVQQSYR
jgi:hypothetical protein